jgi:hypothetical protein
MSAQLVELCTLSTNMRKMQAGPEGLGGDPVPPAIRRDRVLYRTRVCGGVGSTDECAADLEA